jgi:YD repeat-containing protein
LVSITATTRTVNLADPNDPLSLTTQTDTAKVNGRTYTSVYDATSQTFTDTTPAGRQSTATIDTQGRLTRAQRAGLLPMSFGYDTQGRLASATQGSGIDARTTTFSYNNDGYLETLADPLARTMGFTYDAAGRITTQTLPDGRVIGYTYDANGNVASITPPGRPAHIYTYTPVDLNAAYIPPDVGAGANQTLYSYNADRQLELSTRPDGHTIDPGYDSAGRLKTLDFSRGQVVYGYDATTGNLSTITAPDGGILSYSYDGSLLTDTTWAGTVAGAVRRTYDNNLRVTSLIVDGNSITFQYDNDSLFMRVGDLVLTRDPQNGLLTGTTLGGVTDTRVYNGFGELTSYSAAYSGSALFAQQYTRDKLGRITDKIETIGGTTNTFTYGFDDAGRLKEV